MRKAIYNALLELVREYYKSDNLVERYAPVRYNFNIDNCPVNESIREMINGCENNYEKNLCLKRQLTDVLEGRVNNQDLNFWIINDWGGIRRFSKTDVNQNRIVQFFNQLEGNHLCGINAIASLSKVVSFVRPRVYFVYDSRVAYALNWLLRKAGAQNGFFPIPPGQSSLVKKCDLKSVLDHEGRLFSNEDSAYYDYCQLILQLYRDICPKGDEPYIIEMLLFQLAPNEVKNEFINEFQGTPFYCDSSQSNHDEQHKQSITFQSCLIKGRHADFGILCCPHDIPLYIFVGRTQRKIYCELLFKSHSDNAYPLQNELQTDGFVIKGGRSPYLIKLFPIGQKDSARECFENVRDLIFRELNICQPE